MCSRSASSRTRPRGRGGRLLNRLLKNVSIPKLLPFRLFFFFLIIERVKSVSEFVFECQFFFLFLSLFRAHCLHMLISLIWLLMGWSCHIRILTTVPSLQEKKTNQQKHSPSPFYSQPFLCFEQIT